VAELPPPDELVRRLTEEGTAAGRTPAPAGAAPRGGGGPAASLAVVPKVETAPAPAAPAPEPATDLAALARFARFEDVLSLIREARDIKLLSEVEEYVRLVRYRPGLIEFVPDPGAPGDLAGR